MRRVILFSSFLFLASCSSIEVAISDSYSGRFERLAVLPISIKGANWGDEFTDSIQAQLMKQGRFTMVERGQINKILNEQRLTKSGLVEDSEAVSIGRLLNVQLIVLGNGSALKPPKGYHEADNLIDTCTLKFINVETGSILATIRKEPGTEWNAWLRTKYALGFFYFWSRRDIFVESSSYDNIARQAVRKFLEAVPQGK